MSFSRRLNKLEESSEDVRGSFTPFTLVIIMKLKWRTVKIGLRSSIASVGSLACLGFASRVTSVIFHFRHRHV